MRTSSSGADSRAWAERLVDSVTTTSSDEGVDAPDTSAATSRRPGLGLTTKPVAREAGIVVIVYLLYGQVRNLVDGRVSTAEAFASWLLALERSWGLDIELGINEWVTAREPIAVTMNYYYATLHLLVPVAVLVWLWRRHRAAYSLSRNALVLGSLIALLGYWLLPLAPPRLLPELGYIDTFWYYDTWGSLSDPALARFSNQYAAMPSLHVGWALWVGAVLLLVSRRWWVRALAVAYPAATVVVVMGTANHFVLDAVGSVVVMGAGGLLAVVWLGPEAWRPQRRTAAAVTALLAVALASLVLTLRPPYEAAEPVLRADAQPDPITAEYRGAPPPAPSAELSH